MAKQPRPKGPKDWRPGLLPGAVSATKPGETYVLKHVREITSKKDLPEHPDLRISAETALVRKDPAVLYVFHKYKGRRLLDMDAGTLLWFPTFLRAGIVFWPEAQIAAEWTDADTPLDALSKWAAGEMEDGEQE